MRLAIIPDDRDTPIGRIWYNRKSGKWVAEYDLVHALPLTEAEGMREWTDLNRAIADIRRLLALRKR